MAIFARRDEGYTRGGMDVESAINLFFKGVLLFPIFLFAGYIGITMMKHMIFHGIPSMNRPTPEQIERLQERDSQIGNPAVREEPAPVPQSVEEPNGVIQVRRNIDEDNRRHGIALDRHQVALQEHESLRREWSECISNSTNVVCGHLHPGQVPSFSTFYP